MMDYGPHKPLYAVNFLSHVSREVIHNKAMMLIITLHRNIWVIRNDFLNSIALQFQTDQKFSV